MAKRRTLVHPNKAHKHRRGHHMVSCSIRGGGKARTRSSTASKLRSAARRRPRRADGTFK